MLNSLVKMKRNFSIRGLEVGGMIPFPVHIILYPVLKINSKLLGKNVKRLVKEVFVIRGPEMGEIIPFPVCIFSFPVLKTNFELLG